MSDSSTTPSSPSPRYSPSPEVMQRADVLLKHASSDEMECAARAYQAYGAVTEGRSAVTGAELPRFDSCPPLVRAGWLSVARGMGAPRGVSLPHSVAVDVTALRPEMDRLQAMIDQVSTPLPGEDIGQVDPFIMGISEIATATRELAEAERMADSNGAVSQLIYEVADALKARVKVLAPPTPAS